MKANELRIGNYVYFNEQLEQIDLDSFHGIGTFYCISSYSAIPLTEEWLIKFGFVKEKHGWFVLKRGSKKTNNLKMFHIASLDGFSYKTKGCMMSGYKGSESVHQLQNLYFALTGEEIEIK
jgi:hypothetical protein